MFILLVTIYVVLEHSAVVMVVTWILTCPTFVVIMDSIPMSVVVVLVIASSQSLSIAYYAISPEKTDCLLRIVVGMAVCHIGFDNVHHVVHKIHCSSILYLIVH